MSKTDKSNIAVSCRDCNKTIGIYEGEGDVIGICRECHEKLF